MRSFLQALGFLTVIPVKAGAGDERLLPGSMVYFPLVGALLGLILTATAGIFSGLALNSLAVSVIVTVLLIVLTGGLHSDGLADTCDALFCGKDREKMLEIMRDSRIGVMGALGLISVTLLKIAFISGAGPLINPAPLVLMCVLSRWSLVFSAFMFPAVRSEGKGKIFIDGASRRVFIIATLITFACLFMAGRLTGLAAFAAAAATAYGFNKYLARKLGGITGDTLGATNELVEVVTLFSVCILQQVI